MISSFYAILLLLMVSFAMAMFSYRTEYPVGGVPPPMPDPVLIPYESDSLEQLGLPPNTKTLSRSNIQKAYHKAIHKRNHTARRLVNEFDINAQRAYRSARGLNSHRMIKNGEMKWTNSGPAAESKEQRDFFRAHQNQAFNLARIPGRYVRPLTWSEWIFGQD